MKPDEESPQEAAYHAAVGALQSLLVQYIWLAVPDQHESQKRSDWAWKEYFDGRQSEMEALNAAMPVLAASLPAAHRRLTELMDEFLSHEKVMTDFIDEVRPNQFLIQERADEFGEFMGEFNDKLGVMMDSAESFIAEAV